MIPNIRRLADLFRPLNARLRPSFRRRTRPAFSTQSLEVRMLLTATADIRADEIWDGSAIPGEGTRGEGILIGIIDSGLDFDHPSFAEVGPVDGYQHENPFGDGNYLGIGDPTSPDYDPTIPFNNKIVGAYDFTPDTDINSAAFADHGTSVAAIAAGNVVDATLPGDAETFRISGVAPHANLIVYDVCDSSDNCSSSAIVQAVDQAIANGVDVLNMSIGGGLQFPWTGLMATAMQRAHEAGIFVAVSAGNDGPDFQSITDPGEAPWLTAVGAADVQDEPATFVQVLADNVPTNLQLINASPGDGVDLSGDSPPALARHVADVLPGNPLGSESLTPEILAGQVAVIDRGSSLFETKVGNAVAAGAVAVVVVNNVADGTVVMAGVDQFSIPSVMISQEDGQQLRQYLDSNPEAQLSIVTRFDDTPVPEVASFSSRGSNRQIDTLAPAVTAPGGDNQVIAAVATDGGDRWEYFSGTSAASPHVAGAAALLASLHPDWTPTEIQSALQLTSVTDVELENQQQEANPFETGSGFINVAAAANAGFVLPETAEAFEQANPNEGGDPRNLNLAAFINSDLQTSTSWNRTLVSTQNSTVTWTASFESDSGLILNLNDSQLTVAALAEASLSLTATVNSAAINQGTLESQNGWLFGQVILTPDADLPEARLPVAVQAASSPAVIVETSGSGTQVSETGAIDTYTIRLATVPANDVTIRITPASRLQVSLSETEAGSDTIDLTLDSTEAVTVYVSAIDDEILNDEQQYHVEHSILSTSSSEYLSVNAAQVDQVSVFDDESPEINFGLRVPEFSFSSNRFRSSQPVLNWNPIDGIQEFEVVVTNFSDGTVIETATVNGNSFQPSTPLVLGRYQLEVRSVTPQFVSRWAQSAFVVDLGPTIVPLATQSQTQRPTIQWAPIPGAASYEIYVSNITTNQQGIFHQAGLTEASWVPDANLSLGLHRFWVRATSAKGVVSSWSAVAETSIGPQLQSLASTFNRQPTFQWTLPQQAATALIYVRLADGRVIQQAGLTSGQWTPESPLPDGRTFWWVQAFTESGQAAPWSQRQETFVGGRSIIDPPVASAEPSTFSWTSVQEATSYEIFVQQVGTSGPLLRITDLPTQQFHAPILLPGDYRIWVRPHSDQQAGYWSLPVELTVDAPDVSTSATLQPAVVTTLHDAQLQWNPVSNATGYDVYAVRNDGQQSIFQPAVLTTQYSVPDQEGEWNWWVRPVFESEAGLETGTWSHPGDVDFSGRTSGLSTEVENLAVTLAWIPVQSATRYVVQVDRLSDGETILREDNVQDTSLTFDIEQPGEYRFWVRAISANNTLGPWSFGHTFSV